MPKEKHEYTKAAQTKGWSMVELAYRWGISRRQLLNISKSPKQKDWDALVGIPAKEKSDAK